MERPPTWVRLLLPVFAVALLVAAVVASRSGPGDQVGQPGPGSTAVGQALLWTVDSLGWRGLPPVDVVRRCLDGAAPGAIYLFHVGSASTDHTALQAIIDGLVARGYGFVTASGLVAG